MNITYRIIDPSNFALVDTGEFNPKDPGDRRHVAKLRRCAMSDGFIFAEVPTRVAHKMLPGRDGHVPLREQVRRTAS